MVSRIEQARQLQDRTKKFAIRVIQAFARLTKDEAPRIIGRQFLRSATAAGAKMPRLEELYSSLQALEGRNRPRQKVSSP